MAFFFTGTATGPGAVDSFINILSANMVTNGWTVYDSISSTPGSLDIVFKGGVLDPTALNAPFIRITEVTGGGQFAIDLRCYQDWDVSTHAGINEVGNGFGSTRISLTDASFVYWMRCNPVSISFCARIASNYNKGYLGYVRRGLSTSRSGSTKTTTSNASGVTVFTVASDMTTKLKVGQTVQIQNYAHSSASANAGNVETKVLSGITSTTLTFTAATSKAYDAGAIIGENCHPVCIGVLNVQGSNGLEGASFYFPTDINGNRTGSLNHTATPTANNIGSQNYDNPSVGWGTYGPAVITLDSSASGASGFRGFPYHTECTIKGTQSPEDIMTDGDNNFIVLGTSTLCQCMGPM